MTFSILYFSLTKTLKHIKKEDYASTLFGVIEKLDSWSACLCETSL